VLGDKHGFGKPHRVQAQAVLGLFRQTSLSEE